VRDPGGIEGAAIAAAVDLAGKHVIEVGCGDGRLTRFLAEHAGSVFAFDPNAEAVAKAQRSLNRQSRRRVRFAAHSAQALNLPRRRFDLAVCGWSL
jgi:ubiquinone/menaquinone biosynthesis C-methylase UbiE